MIGERALGRLRSASASAMNTTAVIVRPNVADDGAGGTIEGAPTRIGPLACRLRPAAQTGVERTVAERLAPEQTWLIALPVDTDLRETDRVETGGATYEVVVVLDRSLAVDRRCIARRSAP